MPKIFQSLIQSSFGATGRNFEAVIQEDDRLQHWFRDDVSHEWKRGQTIIAGGVAGGASLIQSDFRSGSHGDFEGVVPLRTASGMVELWHFRHDNSDTELPWELRGRMPEAGTEVLGSGALIQSDFMSGGHSFFEVVVPRGQGGRAEL